ncbi:hypothetical protein [Chitinophaga pinensis]|uniref:Hybrid sensor histidine kinase/response regulator n=1 Tax=Chitinophaga pinensis TaxID=79329 RepID=A0A5C6LTU4_9BACT|nr:hypothetical protein [Chitinophaga pinensis]TWV99929.1 hypothetical protein FEF09_13075 [Chitinophaga pinensis]
MEDGKARLWIGSDDGALTRYNLTEEKLDYYFRKTEKLPDLRVLFTDSKGRVWVGQSGLYRFHELHNEFELYTHAGGLGTVS